MTAANDWGANIFISIQANSAGTPATRGTESIYPNNHHISQSRSLATNVHDYLTQRYPSSPRAVYMDTRNLAVLRNTQMPAVVTELLYMTNSQDLALLKNSAERDWMAYYIWRGIKHYWCAGLECEFQD